MNNRAVLSFLKIMGIFCTVFLSMQLHAKTDMTQRQCFRDANSAYQYLLQQQQVQARQQQNQILTQQLTSNNNKIQMKININRASEAELVQLKGIGSKRAQDIILYREMMGGFVTVDDLTDIKGIGSKTLEKNRHRLSVVD